MPEVTIRLDRSKPFSECQGGERTPDDPHYRVRYFQGGKLGKDTVTLPFDAAGELVPDDGSTTPIPGLIEGKPVFHQPLYTKGMREYLVQKTKRLAAAAVVEPEDDDDDADEQKRSAADDVDFVAWLRGEVRYEPHLLRTAAKARFSRTYGSVYPQMVVDLVLDEKIVGEDEVGAALRKHLPKKAA